MAELLDSDLMLVNRSGTSYKVTGAEVKVSQSMIYPPQILAPTDGSEDSAANDLTFVGTIPTGSSITTWGNATWEVDTTAGFGSAMTATKAITTGVNQTLSPDERGSISLEEETEYYVRLKYASTDPNRESEYSEVVTFKTDSNRWQSAVNTPATQGKWYGIAYGNGYYVAVSNTGEISRSTDAKNWVSATTIPTKPGSIDYRWEDVAFGEGTFVAVASDSDKVVISTDNGDTWSEKNLPSNATWRDIVYGNGTFIALANNQKAAYSPNGNTWTQANMPASNNWWEIAYGEPGGTPTFVAVAQAGSTPRIAVSTTNGATWTSKTSANESANWRGIVYGDNKFVTVSSDATSNIGYSTDGNSWTVTSAPSNGTFGVAHGVPNFVSVGKSGINRVNYSSDGIVWTEAAAAEDNSWHAVTYGGGKYVAVAEDGTNRIMYSATGEADPATFLAYDEVNQREINDAQVISQYGVDPTAESEKAEELGIYPLTELPEGYALSHYRKEDDDTYTAVPHCITMQEMEMVKVIRNFQDTLASFRARFGLPATQEIPQAIDGYFPLYTSEAESDLASDNGESHEHEINGVTYYMPDTGVTLYHGTYEG